MKPRTTLTLVALGGAFFAYIWLVEREQKTTRELADSQAKVIEADASGITSLSSKMESRSSNSARRGAAGK